MISRPSKTRWSREQIQAARRASLPELLRARGFQLREAGAENYRISEHPAVVVKDCFWRSCDDEKARPVCRGGNAIDFFIYVLGMSFNEAMEEITR